jgi:hypothetical protein
LKVVADGRPKVEQLAEVALSPVVMNALVAMNFVSPRMAKSDMEKTGITAFTKIVRAKADAVAKGDMSGIETMLVAQMVGLDAVFTDLLMRSQRNMGQYLPAAEIYMRLALKAQSQCRTAAESLAEIKNPRPVFARNFNAVAGNQQVNNSAGPQQVNNSPGQSASSEPSRAEKTDLPSNKLLETA